MIIDFHQHYLPEQPQYPQEPGQAWLYTDSRVQGYRDVGAVLADMDEAGIDRIVWQGEYLRSAENCRDRNIRVATATRVAPTRLAAFASIQPNAPTAIDDINHACSLGCVGIGELNAQAQGFSIRDVQVQRVFAYCAQQALPVLLHVNEPVGPAYMGKVHNSLMGAYELAARYPELPLILAHWGGGLWWYEQIPAVQRVLKNVWYDTAASFFTYPNTALMAHMAGLIIPYKVLYGSDYPLRPLSVPQGWLREWTHTMRNAAPPPYQSAWMGGNALQVLHAERIAPPTNANTSGHLPLSATTPIVCVAESWPDRLPILERWGIRYSAHTPWWQTIAHALSESGHGPEALSHLMDELCEGL